MKRNIQKLSVLEVIERGTHLYPEEVQKLVDYLNVNVQITKNMSSARIKVIAKKIEHELRYNGSNDIAYLLRGGEGVEYREVTYDICKFLKIKASEVTPAYINENKIIGHLFHEALSKMSKDELKELLDDANLSSCNKKINWALTTPAIVSQIIKMGGFTSYKMAVIIANSIARALLNRGLSFGANILLTRTISVLAGPIGWIISGAWLAIDLAGPAYRKTVPAVCQMALLRQLINHHTLIAIAGDGSTGKDALLTSVFGFEGQSHPVPGSTKIAECFEIEKADCTIYNLAGFNDTKGSTEKNTHNMVELADMFIMVCDVNRFTNNDVNIYKKLKSYYKNKPVLVCCNKADLTRNDEDLQKLIRDIKDNKLKGIASKDIQTTIFDPDPRLGASIQGIGKVHEWIVSKLDDSCKEDMKNYFSNV
ncbi:GTPase [Lentisphaerota bacterium WC36G]|nr:50S ribosome-binding GTPase [Lentisphaerae bacterium WC36]